MCEVCGRKGADFLCVSCRTYQCAGCCSEKHLRTPSNGNHMYFAIEGAAAVVIEQLTSCPSLTLADRMVPGSSPKLVCYSQWSPMYLEVAVAAYRQTNSVLIKSERGLHPAGSFTDTTMRELSGLNIHEAPLAQSVEAPAPPNVAPVQPSTSAAFVVDLTGSDDEQASDPSGMASGSSDHIKPEPRVKSENAWLTAATIAPANDEAELDSLLGQILEDDDIILRTMIAEYNKLSGAIYRTENEVTQLRQKAKDARNMQEIMTHRQAVQALHARLSQQNQERTNAVARIVVCIKSDPAELKALMAECTLNIPGAQLECHRKCAVTEAAIREKLVSMKRLRDGMTSAVSMKKQAFEEIKRLGDMIASEEAATRRLHQERIEEFLRLCSFSQQIQTAVHRMAGSQP